MGIIRKNYRNQIRLFEGSQTYENVVNERWLVVNVVIDPVVFVRTAFGNLDYTEFDTFSIDNKQYPFLKDALIYILFECSDLKFTKDTLVADILPVHACINRNVIKAPNRGFNAVLDASIHATRYLVLGGEQYLNLIYELEKIVKKCGGTREKQAMRLLYNLLNIDD